MPCRPASWSSASLQPLTDIEGLERLRRHGSRRVRDGVDPANYARAADGCPLLPGDDRGLQGGAARRRSRAEAVPAADDCRRHDRARARTRARSGRGGAAGDCDDAPAGSRRLGVRRASSGEGAGRVARGDVPGAGRSRRGDRGRVRDRAVAGGAGTTAGGARGAHRLDGRRDHDCARARPSGAQADSRFRGRGGCDPARWSSISRPRRVATAS